MDTTKATWSKPYYGVQHLDGLRNGFQVTVTDRGSIAECSVFLPGHQFRATTSVHPDAAAARIHGESQAVALDAFAQAVAV